MSNFIRLFERAWLGVLIGILGLALAVYQTWRRAGPRLVYQGRGQRLIGGVGATLPAQIEVRYSGTLVPRLTSTQIILWNTGTAPIKRNDISTADPLRLLFESETTILEVSVVKVTRPATQVTANVLSAAANEVLISFDFLDHYDGALISVLHTDRFTRPKLRGTVVGIPKGLKYLGGLRSAPSAFAGTQRRRVSPAYLLAHLLRNTIYRTVLFGSTFVAGCTALLVGLIPTLLSSSLRQSLGLSESIVGNVLFVALGLLYTVSSATALWTDRRRFPKALDPDTESERGDAGTIDTLAN